jgi:hypothetical protein
MAKTNEELKEMGDKIITTINTSGANFEECLGVLQGVLIWLAVSSKVHLADILYSFATSVVKYADLVGHSQSEDESGVEDTDNEVPEENEVDEENPPKKPYLN